MSIHPLTRAEKRLMKEHGLKKLGRFQIEVAIQSVHCDRWKTGKTDWHFLVQLYEGLQKNAPTVGGAVATVAMGEAIGAEKGLACLDQIENKLEKTFNLFGLLVHIC